MKKFLEKIGIGLITTNILCFSVGIVKFTRTPNSEASEIVIFLMASWIVILLILLFEFNSRI